MSLHHTGVALSRFKKNLAFDCGRRKNYANKTVRVTGLAYVKYLAYDKGLGKKSLSTPVIIWTKEMADENLNCPGLR